MGVLFSIMGFEVTAYRHQVHRNRIAVVFHGMLTQRDMERLSLIMLRESSALRSGFDVVVDARLLRIDDASNYPMLSKVFQSLFWFGVGRVYHLSSQRSDPSLLRYLYGSSRIGGGFEMQHTTNLEQWGNWLQTDLDPYGEGYSSQVCVG